MQLPAYFYKYKQTHLGIAMAAFLVHLQSWVVQTKIIWTAKPKIYCLYRKKFIGSWSKYDAEFIYLSLCTNGSSEIPTPVARLSSILGQILQEKYLLEGRIPAKKHDRKKRLKIPVKYNYLPSTVLGWMHIVLVFHDSCNQHHKLAGLKDHSFIILQFWESEVQNGSHCIKITIQAYFILLHITVLHFTDIAFFINCQFVATPHQQVSW